MVKIKVTTYWTGYPDKEREDTFYVDEYNENVKRHIYDWIKSYFIEDIPSDEELEKNHNLFIEVEGAVFLCDLCGREAEKLHTISLVEKQKDYSICESCFQKVENSLEEFREENLRWKTEILGNK
jgi:hypothetical protein